MKFRRRLSRGWNDERFASESGGRHRGTSRPSGTQRLGGDDSGSTRNARQEWSDVAVTAASCSGRHRSLVDNRCVRPRTARARARRRRRTEPATGRVLRNARDEAVAKLAPSHAPSRHLAARPSADLLNMPNIKVALPRVHLAGSDAHHNAHLEVGPHGFALVLSPDAEHPILDIDGTPSELDDLVRALNAALATRTSANVC